MQCQHLGILRQQGEVADAMVLRRHRAYLPTSLSHQLQRRGSPAPDLRSLPVTFIEPSNGFFWRRQFYGAPDDLERFMFFSRAALEWLLASGKQPDILHLHDWQSAAVVSERRRVAADAQLHKAWGSSTGPVALTRHAGRSWLTEARTAGPQQGSLRKQTTENPGAAVGRGVPGPGADAAALRLHHPQHRECSMEGRVGLVFSRPLGCRTPDVKSRGFLKQSQRRPASC
jgi:hypothetical protein